MMTLIEGLCLVGLTLGPLTCLDVENSDDPSVSKARRIWIDECADCHGLAGDGDGKLAATLTPRPPDFKDPCRKITDAWIERVILSGGASYGGSEAMRPHHQLEHEPEVLANLVTFVQALRDDTQCRAAGDRDPPPPPIEDPP